MQRTVALEAALSEIPQRFSKYRRLNLVCIWSAERNGINEEEEEGESTSAQQQKRVMAPTLVQIILLLLQACL